MKSEVIEIVVFINSEGKYEVGPNHVEAEERYRDNIGTPCECRAIRLDLVVPLPEPIEVAGKITNTDGQVKLTIG